VVAGADQSNQTLPDTGFTPRSGYLLMNLISPGTDGPIAQGSTLLSHLLAQFTHARPVLLGGSFQDFIDLICQEVDRSVHPSNIPSQGGAGFS